MRLSEPKIQYLAGKMADWLAGREDVELVATRPLLARELAAVIRDELRLEDDLDLDVEAVLAQYRKQIDSESMDVNALRQKIKRQLARERGIIL